MRDIGNLVVPTAEQLVPPTSDEPLRYLDALVEVNRALARRVESLNAADMFPLVLGGDHSLTIGAVNGIAWGRRVGLIVFDAHADFNTARTIPCGNIHGMGVALLTGRGHPSLTALLGTGPVLCEHDVALVGTRDLDAPEREALHTSGIHIFTMHDIDRRGLAAVTAEAIARVSVDTTGLYVSLDMDVLDPHEAPGVGTPVSGGISYREAHLAMELVAESGSLLGMDLVEVNPNLDTHNATARCAVALALSALGQRIL